MNTAISEQHVSIVPKYIEVRSLGEGKLITQAQMLEELDALNKGQTDGTSWRIETKHELFGLVSRLTHKNMKGAYSTDDSIEPDVYWTDEETPWFEGGRVVVGFGGGDVSGGSGSGRAFARAVRVSGQ